MSSNTAPSQTSFESSHEDMIHDAKFDYYGKRLATCSSDRTIKVFDINEQGKETLVADLKGHDGPVWQVDWAHPQFGRLLASCSYDHKVFIWKETNNKWDKIFEYKHESSVNSISWAPHELGLVLASASSDCTIAIISFHEDTNQWNVQTIKDAHRMGCNAISWAPATPASALISQSSSNTQTTNSTSSQGGDSTVLRKALVTGGGDNLAKIWEYNMSTSGWELKKELKRHTEWIRDVAWAPNIGLPQETIATCGQDKNVFVWTLDSPSSEWIAKQLGSFDAVVWKVSWSITGNVLAVSCADNKVTLWKEASDGAWKKISSFSE